MEKHYRWLRGRRTLANLFVVLTGIAFYMFLANFSAVCRAAGGVVGVLSPFVAGFAIAYLLNIPMRWLEDRVFARMRYRRVLSITATYLVAAVLLSVLLGSVVPQVIQSVRDLINNAELYLANLNALMLWMADRFQIPKEDLQPLFWSYRDIVDKAADMLTVALPHVVNFGVALGNGLVTALTALICSVYMLASRDRLLGQIRKVLYACMPTSRARRVLEISRKANGVFAGFIGGKIIDSAIIGVLCFIGMSLLHMQYAVLISVIVGVTNVIPFFGPFIGAIPSIMILLIVDPWSALKFAVFVLALQQFDGNILGPKILGDSTGLSAIWVLVAIVVGGGLFGFPGMVLGVPAFAVLYSLAGDWLAAKLKQRGLDANGDPLVPEASVEQTE